MFSALFCSIPIAFLAAVCKLEVAITFLIFSITDLRKSVIVSIMLFFSGSVLFSSSHFAKSSIPSSVEKRPDTASLVSSSIASALGFDPSALVYVSIYASTRALKFSAPLKSTYQSRIAL